MTDYLLIIIYNIIIFLYIYVARVNRRRSVFLVRKSKKDNVFQLKR